MVRYLSLISYTNQGIGAVDQSPERATKFREQVEAVGGNVIATYWSTGKFDGCLVFEVPTAEAGASLLLGLAKLGNVRTKTMQIFDESEFAKIVASS